MLKRLKQFYRAVFVSAADIDEGQLNRWLEAPQLALFHHMRLFDQYHCQNVAQAAWRLSQQRDDIDKELLMQASLLHDIGRQAQYIILGDKVLAVLLAALSPRLLQWLSAAQPGQNFWQKRRFALYLYRHHAAYSGRLLAAAGYRGKLLEIVTKHHQPPTKTDCQELCLLRQADELN